jgi:hypothetical protein
MYVDIGPYQCNARGVDVCRRRRFVLGCAGEDGRWKRFGKSFSPGLTILNEKCLLIITPNIFEETQQIYPRQNIKLIICNQNNNTKSCNLLFI